MTRLRIGFVPLTDAAALIIAERKGFAAAQGLSLDLVRETSWSSLRDRLVVGHFDAAHCLAPLAITTTLGLGHLTRALKIPLVLSLSGNAVTLSPALAMALAAPLEPLGLRAKALVSEAKARRRAGNPLTFATVFRFSSHTLLLRRLFALGGGNLDEDADLVVLPPSLMVEGLGSGMIAGFCAGSPWNLSAVQESNGTIYAIGQEIMPGLMEKVLAVPADTMRTLAEPLQRLVASLHAAGNWLSDPGNHEVASSLLAASDAVGSRPEHIHASLSGRLVVSPSQELRIDSGYLSLNPQLEPAAAITEAGRLVAEMTLAGQIQDRSAAEEAVAALFDID
jgi:two-component system, oxyanion-binding sensor